MKRLTPTEIREHARDAAGDACVFYPSVLVAPAGLHDEDREAVVELAAQATFRALLPGDTNPGAWLRGRAAIFEAHAEDYRTWDMDVPHVAVLRAVARELRRCADALEAA